MAEAVAPIQHTLYGLGRDAVLQAISEAEQFDMATYVGSALSLESVVPAGLIPRVFETSADPLPAIQFVDGEPVIHPGVEADYLQQGRIIGETAHFMLVAIRPDQTEVVPNIRPIDPEHLLNLALSILNSMQLQPCIGFRTEQGSVRVIAGQHRRLAMEAINHSVRKSELHSQEIDMLVWVFREPLTEAEVLNWQLSENLQHPMDPEEEAEAITLLWLRMQQAHTNPTYAQLAEKIGRSVTKVARSLRYMRLHPWIRNAVNAKALSYSAALRLSPLPVEDQPPICQRAIMEDWTPAQVRKRVDGHMREIALQQEVDLMALFERQLLVPSTKDHDLTFRRIAEDRKLREMGYLQRLTWLLEQLRREDGSLPALNETAFKALVDIVGGLEQAKALLENIAPELVARAKTAGQKGLFEEP